MTNFLASCTCRGRRPKHLGNSPYRSREEILSRLVRHRHTLRFLVAPNLFGKTTLCLEYAESIFSFERVFWMNGRSSCFMRDLDKDIIASSFLAECTEPALLIIDDLPLLSDVRKDAFLGTLGKLMEGNWEVIVSMLPACDVFGPDGKDVLRIQAEDFLLSDLEIDFGRAKAECLKKPASSYDPLERIPGMFWQDGKRQESLLACAVKEELSDQALLVLFIMVVLGKGNYEDVAVFLKSKSIRSSEKYLKHYGYLGIDPCQQSFITHPFTIEEIAGAFSVRFENMVKRSLFKSQGALILRIADAVLGRGDPERACCLVKHLVIRAQRALWLGNRCERLTQEACILPAHNLYEGVALEKNSFQYRLMLEDAWRLHLLSQPEKAKDLAQRLLRSKKASFEVMAGAALLLLYMGVQEEGFLPFILFDEIIYSHPRLVDPGRIEALISIFIEDGCAWKVPVVMEFLLRDRPDDCFILFETAMKMGAPSLLVTKMFLRYFSFVSSDLCNEGARLQDKTKVTESICLAFRHLEWCTKVKRAGTFEACLVNDLANLRELHRDGYRSDILFELKELSRTVELALLEQKDAFEQQQYMEGLRLDKQYRVRIDESRQKVRRNQFLRNDETPPLTVKLFGGLEVCIGPLEIDPKLLGRKKVKTLLALMVINQGKEIPRDRLAHIMWPDSTSDAARRNLHSVWSLLRKALQPPTGCGPYLIRTQFSYKIDTSHLISDTAEFSELCRRLLFGHPHVEEWTYAFTRINSIYKGDLLPTEIENEAILRAREEYRIQLVDSFAMAALRLVEAGEHQMALWFAQSALSYDDTREDAYSLLMRAQVALGQRTAALDTYFRCSRRLSDKLGIDPGLKTRHLYQEIISEEEVMTS